MKPAGTGSTIRGALAIVAVAFAIGYARQAKQQLGETSTANRLGARVRQSISQPRRSLP